MTLHFNLQQNSNEDKIDVDITRCIFQQYKTSICVRGILNTLFIYCIYLMFTWGALFCFLIIIIVILEISETITYRRCHGELFRTLTQHTRKYPKKKKGGFVQPKADEFLICCAVLFIF